MHCEKRRKIIRREQNGTQSEIFRCANTAACTYRKQVDEDICQHCILSVPFLLHPSSCGDQAPRQPVYKQPLLGDEGEIIYEVVNAEPPPCPDGYRREGWTFFSGWVPCQHRIQLNRLTPTGGVQITCFCNITKQIVTTNQCEYCKLELQKVEAIENILTVPEMPGLSTQINHYWHAIKTWISKGRPARSEDEVKQIFQDYCSRCDWFDIGSQKCKGCGCNVKPEGVALLNKIKMATEHCPRNFW